MGINATKIRVELGGTTILENIDFRANDGELVGVLGPSGSGKSTLLLALSGFRPAQGGSVRVDGRDLYERFESMKDDIGYVPQDDIVPMELGVERVLKYAAELRLPDLSADARRGRVTGVIQKLGLADRRELKVSKLSGGQRKRVSVGVELLCRPAILFADEPTSGLDPALERSLTKSFQKLTDDGSTVILTTHVMTSLDLLDKVCVLCQGNLCYMGPVGSLKEYFQVDDYAQIYTRLEQKSPREWRNRWQKAT